MYNVIQHAYGWMHFRSQAAKLPEIASHACMIIFSYTVIQMKKLQP